MTPSSEQIAEAQQKAEDYLREKYGAYRGHFAWRELEEAFTTGHLRARTEQATEIAELKAKLAEVMPSNDPLIVWSVSSEAKFTLFKTLEDAQRYVGQFSASIGGGLYISETAVFGNIVKD